MQWCRVRPHLLRGALRRPLQRRGLLAPQPLQRQARRLKAESRRLGSERNQRVHTNKPQQQQAAGLTSNTMRTRSAPLEVFLLQALAILQSYAFRINKTEANDNNRLTEEIYAVLQTLLVANGEHRIRLSFYPPDNKAPYPRLPPPPVTDSLQLGGLTQAADKDSSPLGYWKQLVHNADTDVEDNEDTASGNLQRLLQYAYTKEQDRNKLYANLEHLKTDFFGILNKRVSERGGVVEETLERPLVKKWETSVTSSSTPTNEGTNQLPEIYRDICRSYSDFELLKSAVNDALQMVEVLPNTWVWTTKCSEPESTCSSIAPGVVARCKQKQAWVQAFARLHENDPWRWHWIAVNSSCNCGVRVGY